MKRVDLVKVLGTMALSAALALAAPGAKGDKKKGENGKAAAGKGDVAKGETSFKQNCAVCHNATSTETRIGPGLKGLFKRQKMVNGKAVNEANVKEFIREGDSKMMGFKERLEPKELDDLVAYLRTL